VLGGRRKGGAVHRSAISEQHQVRDAPAAQVFAKKGRPPGLVTAEINRARQAPEQSITAMEVDSVNCVSGGGEALRKA